MAKTIPFSVWLITMCWIASACADLSFENDAESAMDDMDTDAPADISEDTAQDTGFSEEALYFSIDGTILIEDSLLVLEETELSIGFWTAKPELLCEQSLIASVATAYEDLPPEQFFSGWTLEYDPSQLCKNTSDIPIGLGIGVMSDALNPVLDFESLDGSHLYGLYYIETTKTQTSTFVFGVAGTNQHYEGGESPVLAGPLPDGTYTLLGLHLLPMPAQ
jgi:hypothetical protein